MNSRFSGLLRLLGLKTRCDDGNQTEFAKKPCSKNILRKQAAPDDVFGEEDQSKHNAHRADSKVRPSKKVLSGK